MKISRKRIAALAMAIVGGAVGSAQANDVFCSGTVYDYLVYSSGDLMIHSSWRNQWTVLCNTQGNWRGISSETCFSWLAIVGSTKVHNKTLGVYYTSPSTIDCATLETYHGAPAPVYVRQNQ